MIGGDQPLRGSKIFGGPVIQIGANAQRSLHRTEHAVGERGRTEIEPVRRIRNPGHHDLGRVGVGETVLHGEAVGRIRVVRRPDFVGVAQDSQVYAPATSGTAFDLNLGMFLAQVGKD